MTRFKKGDRVTADLADGRQAGTIVGSWAYGHMVKFDKTPPRGFNMGENPAGMLDTWLTLEEK